MALPKFIEIDGKRILWTDVLKLRRAEQEAAQARQLPLFEMREDARPTAERTAAGRLCLGDQRFRPLPPAKSAVRFLGEDCLACVSVIANNNEAAGGERVDRDLIRPATIGESPRALATAGPSGHGNRPDQTRAALEMLKDVAHLVAEQSHGRPW
jgi:hypothetical protein